MGGIAKENFVGMDAEPFRTQPPRNVTANSRGEHSNDDQIEAGADFECAGRYARTAPRRNGREAHPSTKRKENQSESGRATAPAATAAHDTAELSSTGLEISTVSIVSIDINASVTTAEPRLD